MFACGLKFLCVSKSIMHNEEAMQTACISIDVRGSV